MFVFTGFSIEGPSQAKIDCKDNGDGSADVTYFPTAPGEYAVHILCNEDDIPKSPYMVQIQPETKAFNASKVRFKRQLNVFVLMFCVYCSMNINFVDDFILSIYKIRCWLM